MQMCTFMIHTYVHDLKMEELTIDNTYKLRTVRLIKKLHFVPYLICSAMRSTAYFGMQLMQFVFLLLMLIPTSLYYNNYI